MLSPWSARPTTKLSWEAVEIPGLLRTRLEIYRALKRASQLNRPTQIIIWNDQKQKASFDNLEFKTAVLQVRISRSYIIAVLHNSVHVYKFSTPPTKTAVFETADNPLGLCGLGSKIVAFPGRSHGKIQLVELESGNVSIIPAHSSALRAMDLSSDGELLATASETGTLIRVFSTANCARVAELRRGVDPAFIFSISISPSSTMLAVTSDKSTLHVFDLPPRQNSRTSWPPRQRSQSPVTSPSEEPTANQKWGILSKLPLLPRVFSDIYSFASTHFEMGDDPTGPHASSLSRLPALGSLPSRPQKGVIGWVDDETLLVVGAGRDSRWERFIVGVRPDHEDGGRQVWRDGWKRYLGS